MLFFQVRKTKGILQGIKEITCPFKQIFMCKISATCNVLPYLLLSPLAVVHAVTEELSQGSVNFTCDLTKYNSSGNVYTVLKLSVTGTLQ